MVEKKLDMKLRVCFRSESALTLLEVIVVIGILAVLVLMILDGTYAGPAPRLKAQRIQCISNLKQMGMSYRIWEGDHFDSYPMLVSVTNGGSMELAQTGNVVMTYLIMSNEISAPQILWCPADTGHQKCETFASLSISNISYFLNVDASEANPQNVLTGDSNLEINGKPVKSGLVSIWTNDVVSWQPNRHVKWGNIGMADGSVQSATSLGLQSYFTQTGIGTNRLAIP